MKPPPKEPPLVEPWIRLERDLAKVDLNASPVLIGFLVCALSGAISGVLLTWLVLWQ